MNRASELLGIDFPLVGFGHCPGVVAAAAAAAPVVLARRLEGFTAT